LLKRTVALPAARVTLYQSKSSPAANVPLGDTAAADAWMGVLTAMGFASALVWFG